MGIDLREISDEKEEKLERLKIKGMFKVMDILPGAISVRKMDEDFIFNASENDLMTKAKLAPEDIFYGVAESQIINGKTTKWYFISIKKHFNHPE